MLHRLSRAITLLDAFVLNTGAHRDIKHTAPIDWKQLFLEQVALTLHENPHLSDIVEVSTEEGGGRFTVKPKPGVTVDAIAARLSTCVSEYERWAATELDFPQLYTDLLKLSVSAIHDIFTGSEGEQVPGLSFDMAILEQVYTTKSVPFCEPWSTQLDLSFESGGDRGRAIVCPDPRSLTGPSREVWARMATIPGTFYRSWIERAYHALPHELFHCVQSFTKEFYDGGKWFSEYGATAVCVNVLYYMARAREFREAHPEAERLFPAGFLEMLMVDLERDVSRLREEFRETECVDALYAQWAGSGGRGSPEKLMEIEGASYYAKCRIALDAPYIASTEKTKFRELILQCLDSHK